MVLAAALAAALAATGATVFMATGNVDPTVQAGPPASEVIALRFAEDFAPTRKSPDLVAPNPLAPLLSATEFSMAMAAVDAMERARRSNPDGVFNEAQIASIKARLKLTEDQEQHWQPLEAALRGVSWVKPSANGRSARGPVLDGKSVQQLKEAADNLAVLLRADQKREVRLLAHVIGLKFDL